MADQNHRALFQPENSTLQNSSDWMGVYRFHIPGNPDLVTSRNSRYRNVYCQTGSYDSQKTAAEVNRMMETELYDIPVQKIVIVKNKVMNGIASYDHIHDELFLSEELSDPAKFDDVVGTDYFPARNLHDIMIHEVCGHKKHWDSVKTFYRDNQNRFSDLIDAKIELESDLHKYVSEMNERDQKWIADTISLNAYDSFAYPRYKHSELNELIADAILLKKYNKLKDDQLWCLIKEVIFHDD